LKQIIHALKRVTAAATLVIAGIVFVSDFFTPRGVCVTVLYVIPLIISLLADKYRLTLSLAGLCSILVVAGHFVSPDVGVARWVTVSNGLIALFLLWAVAYLGLEITKAKIQIRELGRLLTICAWTKQIKIENQWISIEEYLTHYQKLRLTHGISREAAEKFLQDFKLEVR
jgi:small-conductance mechanosensitive channel